MFNQYRPLKLRLMLWDVVVTVCALALIEHLRPYLPGRVILVGEALPSPILYLIVALVWHLVFAITGAYEDRDIPSFSHQVQHLLYSYSLSILLFAGILFFSLRDVSRMLVIYFAVVNFAALLSIRFAMTEHLRATGHRLDGGSVLIVGASENGQFLARGITQDHHHAIKVVGFLDDHVPSGTDLPAPIIGSTAELEQVVREQAIDLVVIALPEHRARDVDNLVLRLDSLPVRVYLIPDLSRLSLVSTEIETIGNLVVIGIREPAIKGHKRIAKRVLDLVLSSAALAVTWPIMVLIGLAVKLSSPGPALYLARRVGENGRLFNMYKFRTMVVDAEKLQSLATAVDAEGRPIFKIRNDPRITKLGRFLRRTSLDELPQLINVFTGQMSLVGPRPEQPFITQAYDHWQWQRLSVPPGVTGLWQISGRSDLPMHLNTQYDMFYVRNYSTILDLKILLKTIVVLLNGKGAY
jgi:exopolysaccharide biosynthesis polyprenyl glycosylphosphotransferase